MTDASSLSSVPLPDDLTFYPALPDDSVEGLRPLVLVLPGGGYRVHSAHEAGVAGEWLATLGINALVVRYPVAPLRFPLALLRVREVLAGVRSGELALPVDRGRVGVLGFSAGGHLAAQLCSAIPTADGVDAGGHQRPDLAVLAYPLISFTDEPHEPSVVNLLGEDPPAELRRAMSAENFVDSRTPPTFVWHTSEDAVVPVSNSLAYARALAEHRIPFDLHVFERGEHGLGLAVGRPPLEQWTALCAAWLGQRGWV